MDVGRLNEVMSEKGISVSDLSKQTGIERSALYRRFKANGSKFTVEEAKKIVEALGLDKRTAVSIFLR